MRRQAGAQELLDGPLEAPTLEANLRDLARVNRWLGGASLSWRALEPLLPPFPTDRPLRMLDLGTGAGDIPIALAERAARAGQKLEMVATDVRTEIVQIAAARVARAGMRNVEVRLGPQGRIDAGDQSFDVVHASLVLHHLEPSDAQRLLGEMARAASRAVIVNDLDRAGRWLLIARLLSAVATRNRYTRHDAPLSVLRAYRPNELARLAAGAGLVEEARYWARPGYRYAITLRHGEPARG